MRRNRRKPEQPRFCAASSIDAVDVAQRGGEIDEDERKIVDRLDEDDAVQPLHEGDLEPEPVVEQEVDRAVAAEQQLHRHGADEGRHDQRQEAERLDERRRRGNRSAW